MAQISQLIEQAWKHLASKNIPEVARAAWFGNIMQESTWNLHADNNTHRGLCQWDKEYRWPHFLNEFKGNEDNLEDQLNFGLWELENGPLEWTPVNGDGYPKWPEIKQMTDVAQATLAFEQCFERSGGANVPERQGYAQMIYDHFVKGTPLSDDLLGEVPASSGSSKGGADNVGGVYNATAPSDTGTRSTFVTKKKTPKYYDVFNAQKLAIGKTPCQPVYPDIVSVYNQVPEWALGKTLDKTTADNKEVKDATEVKSVSLKDGKTSFESLSTDKVTFGKDKKEDSKEDVTHTDNVPDKIKVNITKDNNTTSDVTKTNDKNTPEAKKEDSDKKSEDTKVENNTLSAQDKSPQKLNPPLYAYDTIDVDDCFNVGLPITSVAAYGSEAAKYQMTRMQSIAQRQIQFDPTKHDNAVKVPTPGMVPNPSDPFPTDLRIRDLELHMPRIVKESIKATEFELNTAKALLEMGGDVEKRMVQVENHLSTVTRYLFRLASIIPINDMYYGGNTLYEKYRAIRQLTDDRVADGMQTQIDQYMTSTRIEPIIGQVYEILNQVGANLSVLLDNNQLSYSNMKHYCDLIDIKRYQEPLKLANIAEGASLTKSDPHKDLKDEWPEGFKMDWKLVPVEEQVPIINWRQSIIDDGSKLMNSPSMYGSGLAAGAAMTGDTNNLFYLTAEECLKSQIPLFKKAAESAVSKISGYKDQAKNIAKSKESYVKMEEAIKNAGVHKDINTVVLAVLMCLLNTSDYDGIINKIKSVTKKLKDESLIDNPLLVMLAYYYNDAYIIGDKPTKDQTTELKKHEDLKTRLDFVYALTNNSGNNNSGGQSKKYFNLDIKNQGSWTLSQFWEPYTINVTGKREEPMDPHNSLEKLIELCVAYKELSKEFYASEFDNDKWGFFFASQYIPSISLSGFPGEVRSSHTHQGMDVVFIPDSPKPEILSICDGTVMDTGWGYNAVMVNAANGTNKTIVYMHMAQIFVKAGDTIKRGQPIGIIGGMGPDGPATYAEHLHIEVWSEPNRGGTYGSIGDLYPGVFQDYCNAYMKTGSQLNFADFKK